MCGPRGTYKHRTCIRKRHAWSLQKYEGHRARCCHCIRRECCVWSEEELGSLNAQFSPVTLPPPPESIPVTEHYLSHMDREGMFYAFSCFLSKMPYSRKHFRWRFCIARAWASRASGVLKAKESPCVSQFMKLALFHRTFLAVHLSSCGFCPAP